MSGGEHPMHPLVDADGRITATGAAFIQRAGEIMDETVAKSVSGGEQGQAGEARTTPAGSVHWTSTALVNLHGGDARAVLRATTNLHQVTCDTCLHLLATDPDTVSEWNEGAS